MSALYLLLTSVIGPHSPLDSAPAKGLPVIPSEQDTADPQARGDRPPGMHGAIISDVRPEAIAPGERTSKLPGETTPAPAPEPGVASDTSALHPHPASLNATVPLPRETAVMPDSRVPVAIAPQAVLRTPRPGSNAQQFAQRLAALYAGRTYTRLAADSFQEQWIDASGQPTYEQWVGLLAHEARAMANGQGNNHLTVMVGDSISQWFPNEQLSTDRFWLNQSISGDNTSGILQRLSLFANTRPDTIHVMAGINDLRQGASDEAVMDNLRQIMRTLRQNHPQAQILIHSILPTRLPSLSSLRIQRLNASIAIIAQQEGVSYLDVMSYVSDEEGNLRLELTTDGLHLNPVGYAMWNWVMRSLSQA